MKDTLLDKAIRFDILLGIVALVIALVAAFFSVYGIATLFGGAFISTVIMGSVLEIGKLVTVSFLYRYWKQSNKWLIAYLSIALVILMVITSGGIFGYLSAAYQKSATTFKAQQAQIVLVEKTKTYAQNRIDQAQTRILVLNEMRKSQESRMSEALTNVMISRNPIALKQLQDQTGEMIKNTESDVKSEQSKVESGIQELTDISKKVNEMTYADNSKDIRTFEFVAKLFNTDLDNVAKWFIFLLIIVFDPLAVALILSYNVASYKQSTIGEVTKEDTIEEIKKKIVRPPNSFTFPQQKIPSPIPTPEPEAAIIPPPISPAEQALMDDPFYKGYFKNY